MYSVTIQEIKDEFELVNLTDEIDLKAIEIESPEVNRPALQLAGFFDYFDSERVQLMGIVEYTYLCKLTPEFSSTMQSREVFLSLKQRKLLLNLWANF